MSDAGRLHGRDHELRAVLDAIAVGAPLVLVTGDAGIGKSRLVTAAVADARVQGFVALLGACVSLSGKLPLLPFVEALRGMNKAEAAAALSRVPAALRPALSALMHTTGQTNREENYGRDEGASERAGWERERLVLAVAAFLSPPARTSPTVLVIEDLHWADPFTLDVLTYLVAGTKTGATCLVTLRADQRPMPEAVLTAVAELQRLDSTVTVELGPIPSTSAMAQAQAILGPTAAPGMLDDVVRLAGGNPFFTEQLCRYALSQEGPRGKPLGALPPKLSGLLSARVRGLTEAGRRGLLLLGLAGRPLTPTELVEGMGMSTSVAAEVVRELTAAAVLAPNVQSGLAPRHALLSAAVAESADPITLAETHVRVAELLERAGDRTFEMAVAAHWAAAGRGPEELRASLVAASVAGELSDFDAAAGLWMRSYSLANTLPEVVHAAGLSELSLAVSAVRALDLAGRTAEGEALAEKALGRVDPLDETLLGGLLRWWVGHFRSLHGLTEAGDTLRDAERVLSMHPPTPELSRCLALLGRIEDISGRPQLALPLVERAISSARACGSLRDEAFATVALSQVLFSLGHWDQGLEEVAAMANRPEVAANVQAQGSLALFESDMLLQRGSLLQAKTVALSSYEMMLREGYGGTYEASILRYNAGEAEVELGQSSRAFELVKDVTEADARAGSTGAHVLRALCALNAGDTQSALDRIARAHTIARAGSNVDDLRCAAQGSATILLWARKPAQALKEVRVDLDALSATYQQRRCGELLSLGAAAVADQATAARAKGDAEALTRADRSLNELEHWVANATTNPFTPVHEGGREHADGMQWAAESTRARGHSDPDSWRRAAKGWEGQLRAHRAAYCWWRLAQAQVERGESASTIAPALQRAYELSEEMAPLRKVVHDIASRANVRLTTAPVPRDLEPLALPHAFTQREWEILQHIVAGRSNTQIAQDLFISPKTVSVHVSNLMRKIGVSNRVQAAAWAEQFGVTQGLEPHPWDN